MPGFPDIGYCKCGCGKSWKTGFSQRNRQYAKDCDNAVARHNAACAEYQARKRARAKAKAAAAKAAGVPPPEPSSWKQFTPKRERRMCQTCFELPWQRPEKGCPECNRPHELEKLDR